MLVLLDLWAPSFHVPMNLRTSTAACVLVLLQLAVAAESGEPQLIWETHLNPSWSGSADSVVDLAVDAQGNPYAFGTTDNIDGLSSSLLVRFDAAGVEKWIAVTMAGGPRFTRGNALALDHSGRPIVVSTSRKADGTDGQLIVMKWSSTAELLYAELLFSALIDQPAGTNGEGVAVVVDANDYFYVLANHHPLGTQPDELTTAYLRKYTPEGELEWALALTRTDAQ